MLLRILAVSDEVDQRIYSTSIRERMSDIDIIIGCGDLPATYLEFLTDALRRPVYYVLGNHAEELTRTGMRGEPRHPLGCTDVGFKVVRDPLSGLIIAGLPGSPRYTEHDPVQFTERQMMMNMLRMAPRLMWNRVKYGKALDVLISHSPPRDVGDRADHAHRGFQVMRRFIALTKPKYQLHGHIHLYDRSEANRHWLHNTEVINVFPYQCLDLEFSDPGDSSETTGVLHASGRSGMDDEGPEVNQPHVQ